jgi:hypothetical protein
MSGERPPARTNAERRSTNVKRRLRTPPLSDDALAKLSERVRYEPYAKHKRHPRAFGLEPIRGISEDPTYCDEHAGFTPDDMRRIPELIKRGIAVGLTSEAEAAGIPQERYGR